MRDDGRPDCLRSYSFVFEASQYLVIPNRDTYAGYEVINGSETALGGFSWNRIFISHAFFGDHFACYDECLSVFYVSE